MKLIPETYFQRGGKKIFYRLFQRSDKVAMYEQYFEGRLIGYEVVLIKLILEDHTYKMAGVDITVKAGEYLPSTADWGKKGFSYRTLEDAEKKFQELIERTKVVPLEILEESSEEIPLQDSEKELDLEETKES